MANLEVMTSSHSQGHPAPQGHGLPSAFSQSFNMPYDGSPHAHPSAHNQTQHTYSQSFPNGPVSNPGYARSFGAEGYGGPGRNYGGKPQIYTAVYSGVHVYEMEVQGVACMRRRSDGWLNATQILKVAGVDKGKRTKVLEKEILVGEHEKVQGGYGKYQGTWISYKRGREFCRQYGVEEMLRPLLDYDVSADGSGGQGQDTPTKEQAMAANRKRFYNHLDSGPSRGPSTNGTFFSNISPSTSVALAAMNKAARLNSPVPRSGNVQRQPSRHHSQHEIFPGGSQQSMVSQNSFDTESRFDSGYGTQPNGSNEPPRKRKRMNSNEGMGPPTLPHDTSMRSATPTEPSESFLYENSLSQEFANAGSDTALPPLPPPNTDEQSEKLNLILDLFAESGRTDYSTHPAILQLSGEDFNMPLDHSSNSALHWAATLAKVSLLKLLLWKGANIWRGNAAGQSPLISAVIVNNCWEHSCFPELLELLSPLIEVRDIQGRTVLHHIAVSSGIKGRAPSSKYYLEALLEFLVRVGTQPGSSNNASATSTAAAVASLASQQASGEDLSQDSHDTLTLNGSKGAVSLVRFLSHIVNAKDKAGNTALNLVARIGNRSIIQQLLEIHADPGLANNKGVSAKDFGVGTESGEGLLANGFASQQSTQQAPASQPEAEAEETQASSSQVEDLSQEVISSLTSMLTQNLTSHKDLLRQRTEQIDRLNEQIRDFSALQKAELERFQEAQARIKSRSEKQAKLANLRRILEEKRAAMSPAAHEESQSGTLELGAADNALVPEDLAAILPNIPASDDDITPEQRSLFTSALPVPSELRTRLHAYSTNNRQLKDHANELRGRSNELEDQYRRVVSLCTGVDEDKVEEALPNLLAAIESESTAGVEGEGDVVRVRDFLRRVDGGQAVGYNDEESYPDLTLRLPDGTTILANKSVLRTSNEHFQRLCAPATPRRRPKSTISLEEPADVVRVLIQTIYGLPIPKARDLSRGFWANLAVAAENFLEPELGKKAVGSFLEVAFDLTDVDTVVEMIGVVGGSMDVALLSALNLVHKHHALILLEHEGYRDSFFDHPRLELLHIDDLLAKVKGNNGGT